MMASTHMGFGFIFTYVLLQVLNKASLEATIVVPLPFLVLIGAVGGAFPDLDRKEDWGLHHRQTLHYSVGYGVASLLLLTINAFYSNSFILVLSCFLAGAWLHSFMDIFGGWWIKPTQSVYEHITKKWIYAYDIFPFASAKEWSLQSFGNVLALLISPFLPPSLDLPGWQFVAGCFALIWLISAAYEVQRTIPERQVMEVKYWEDKFQRILAEQ